jgi:uncharacterized protein (DUF4415 family)
MPRKFASSSAGSPKRSLTKPDNDLPEVTDEALARADLRIGGKLIRRGRPPLGAVSKESVTLRIDRDMIAAFRAGGPGWQTRINQRLRETLRKPPTRRTRKSG